MAEQDEQLVCWKCGASIGELPLPLARLAECPACRVELHVCRMCTFYDTGVAKACREPVAEEVKDKTRANFCDYFQVKRGAYVAPDHAAQSAARAGLDALFGGSGDGAGAPVAAPEDDARRRLDELFGGSDESKS